MSLTVLPQVVPAGNTNRSNVGVIGSGARRSPTNTGLVNSQSKLMSLSSGGGSMESSNSSRSSTSGEDVGFISGSSSEREELPYVVDQLCGQFGVLGLGGKANLNGYSSIIDAASQKGSFPTADPNSLLFEPSNMREFHDRYKDDSSMIAYQQLSQQTTNRTNFLPQSTANLGGLTGINQPRQTTQTLPGAWFYENSLDEGLPGSGSASTGVPGECSPINELNEEYQYSAFRAALNNPFTVDEQVEVPSSEHVAEIVGRQGCKIKALRAKTNTYIKTPSRNEPPVFKITGRPEDVVEAKREIECAAEHFTQIRASRRHSQGGAPAPGHVTAYVRVPLRVVGLVVGPKGATIKRIQQDTHTYIITPSREREPIFEVTGLPENVASARREIEQHIYQRTGNMPITDPSASITDYDLLAAAAHAQAAAHINPANRPNYGALATGTHMRRASAAIEAVLGQIRNVDMMGTYGEILQSGLASKPYSNSVSPPPPPPQAGMFQANQFYGQEINQMNQSAAVLLRSSSNEYQNGNYQTWTSGYSNLGMQSSGGNSFVQELFAGTNGFPFSGNNSCNLNTTKSGSRDEGLGDSPTASCGKLNTEPYHLMSSIWSDIEATNVGDKPHESGVIQLANA